MKTKILFSFCTLLLLIVLQQPLQAQAWKLLGNSGTDPATHFLGTKDNKALVLRTNNVERLRILNTGSVGIGTTAPVQKLDVNGNINMAYGSSLYVANQRVFTMDIGLFPLRGNLFAGASSGISNTTGIHNTASGSSALRNNTTGSDNTASGYQSLYSNTEGEQNTASGYQALYSNTTGVDNTASGYQALYSNLDGNYNTASGKAALYSNTTGDKNTAYGSGALYGNEDGFYNTASGSEALALNTTGDYNTAFGWYALANNSVGSYNTALGANAGTFKSSLINLTALGYGVHVEASNTVRVGNISVTSIGGQVDWTTFSDGRYKKNIKADVKGLAFINSLRPLTYTVDINSLNAYYDKGRKHDSAYEKMQADMQPSADAAAKIVYNGFIAQEVEAAAKKLNYDFSGVDKPQTKDGLYGLRYAEFVVPLVKAVQELSKINDEKDAKIDIQQKQIDVLQKQMNELKSIVLSANPAIQNKNAVALSSASLEQNIPNPFNNSTTISYNIPHYINNARIVITDMKGNALKTVSVNKGAGQITLNGGELAAGTYTYTLYADGKKVNSKQMIITK